MCIILGGRDQRYLKYSYHLTYYIGMTNTKSIVKPTFIHLIK